MANDALKRYSENFLQHLYSRSLLYEQISKLTHVAILKQF